MNIHRLLYSKYSKLIISMLVGFGLATMFRKECINDFCLEHKAPQIEEIEDQIFLHGNDCHTFSYTSESCDKNKKQFLFA